MSYLKAFFRCIFYIGVVSLFADLFFFVLAIEVPEGVQTAEFLFEKGAFDSIVPRNSLKEVLSELFHLHDFFPLTQTEK